MDMLSLVRQVWARVALGKRCSVREDVIMLSVLVQQQKGVEGGSRGIVNDCRLSSLTFQEMVCDIAKTV